MRSSTCCASSSFPIFGSARRRSVWPATASRRPACWPDRTHRGQRRRASADRAVRRRVPPGHPLGAARPRDRVPHAAGRRSCTRATSRSTSRRSTAASPTSAASARSRRARASACCWPTRTNAEEHGHSPCETAVGGVLRQLFTSRSAAASSRPASPATSTASSRSPTPRSPSVASSPRSGSSMKKNVRDGPRHGHARHPRRVARRHRGHRRRTRRARCASSPPVRRASRCRRSRCSAAARTGG